MKRSFLVLALVGAMSLFGSASWALAAGCPAGVLGTQLSGNYAVKVQGAVTDNGSCAGGSTCPDPTPSAIAGIGVLHFDGACAIDGGDFIYSVQGGSGITSPAPINLAGAPFVPNFSGTTSGANDTGSYGFNSNN